MLKISRDFYWLNSRHLIGAAVAVLLLNLLLFVQSPARAADPPPITLSANTGPTGLNLTVKGTLPQEYSQYTLMSIFVQIAPSDGFYLRLGAAPVKKDLTFSWTGPLPRAGLVLFNDGSSREVTLPKAAVTILYGPGETFESQKATFTVTDNANGPYADVTGTLEVYNTWARTDLPVASGSASRSWLWGPTSYEVLEPYKEAPKGWRYVTYYDKARMEITNPAAPSANNPYYVTNGLLVREMVTGQLQLGDNTFETRQPAQVPTAGDFSGANKTPVFAVYAGLQTVNSNQDNAPVTASLAQDGKVTAVPELEQYGVKVGNLIKETNHYIASPFWTFLNSSGPIITTPSTTPIQVNGRIFDPLFSATGYPITEPYWTKTLVGGVEKDVLVQLFERRVLTYTPANDEAYRVEMGNVGLQYYQWRYGTNFQ